MFSLIERTTTSLASSSVASVFRAPCVCVASVLVCWQHAENSLWFFTDRPTTKKKTHHFTIRGMKWEGHHVSYLWKLCKLTGHSIDDKQKPSWNINTHTYKHKQIYYNIFKIVLHESGVLLFNERCYWHIYAIEIGKNVCVCYANCDVCLTIAIKQEEKNLDDYVRVAFNYESDKIWWVNGGAVSS